MRESGAQGQGAGDFNLGGEAGEVGALKRGVLGNQSEGESAGRRVYSLIYTLLMMMYYCCYPVAKSCPTLCDPMDCSTPGFPVLHHLLESVQTHVH